jgi:homoserine O-acetyltransferase/O-succinyltransferase
LRPEFFVRMLFFHSHEPFHTETGAVLPSLTVAYHTYGTLNADGTNVIWICHALTSSAHAAEWWPGMIGPGCIFDPEKYFIVCANILGSCYGTTGPLSENGTTGAPYFSAFPMITIRDMVQAHILLRRHLGIRKIAVLVGGSMGGYQALEWAVLEKARIENLFLLATSATESAWGIAVHTAQRLAIEADPTWRDQHLHAGQNGLKAARAIGLLSYRNYQILVEKQTDPDVEKLDHFKASAYMHHQGDKLVRRFNAYSYWLLTKAMDTHHLGRGRNQSVAQVLEALPQPTLLIAIASDILCPPDEQRFMARHLPQATLAEIDSSYGHDGFLIEVETISAHYRNWMQEVPSELEGQNR